MNFQNVDKPTHLDLCSGTGAFSIAFEAEGFETIGFAEIEDYPCKLLKQNWPHVTNYGDIRNVPSMRCSVITAGVPCQPISGAGRKLGEADDRYIWPAVLDVFKRVWADFLVVENVINVTNLFLARWQDDLEEIGYQSQAFDLPSCAVGLPSVERHVWIVAARREIVLQGSGAECLSVKREELQQCVRRTHHATSPDIVGMWHLPDTRILRSSKGVPNFRNRIAAIGNSVPPPVARIFARAIRNLI